MSELNATLDGSVTAGHWGPFT